MRFVTACTLLAAATLGQADPDFLSADKSLSEQSYARACDGFNAFLKAHADSPLAREAQAKRAASCLRVGRGNTYNELVTLATKGEKDFARAYASWELAQRGERSFDEALALLKQAASGDDRQAKQARALFIAGALRQMENESYNQKKVEQLAAQGLELAGPADAAHLRLLRARTHAQQTKTQPAAEEEFLAVGKGDTQWADNALYDCARLREGLEKYDGALELYDEIVRRFQRSTSDVWESAKSEAAEIRRPWVQLSIGTVELPGVKPIVSWSARNVSDNSLRWQVEKIDPFAQEAAAPFSGDHGAEALHGPVVSQWNQAVKPRSNHAQVNGSFDLQLTDKGAYVVQAVDAAGHRSRAFALITTHVTVLKAGAGQAVVWVVDAITGQAVKDAPVRLFEHDGYEHYRRLEGTTDATGLARFELVDANQNSQSLIAIAKAAGSFSYSNGYANWRGAAEREELLAWGVTDRPLYKPGEKVGLKVFLRSRAAGPSVPVAKEEVVISVRDPQGREVARPSLTSSAFGTVSFDFPLPKNAPLGQWSFYLEDSSRSFSMSSSSFRVEEYKPPEYTVSVTPASKPKPGAAFKVKIAASFFFGGPVANASGRALVNVTAWQHQWGRWPDEAEDEGNGDGYGYGDEEGYGYRGRYGGYYYGNAYFAAQHTLPFKTGADGTAEVEVPAEQVPEGLTGLQYQITALVTDASRREVRGQATLHVAKDSYFADVRTDRFLYKPGEKVRVELRAEDANGEPQSPAVSVRLVRLGEGDRVEATLSQAKAQLKGGHGEAALDPDALGPVRVQVFDTSDAKQERVLASTDLWLTNEAKPILPREPGFHVYTDKGPLKAGQSLRALVVSSGPGGHALVALETDRIVSVQSVELNGRARFVELKLTPDLVPNAWLSVWRIEQLAQQAQERPIKVRGDASEVDVAVRFDAPVSEPGEKVGATIAAPSLPKALPTETAVTFVDEALLALAPERTDFLSWFGRRPRQHEVQTQSSLSQRSYRGPPQKLQAMAQKQPAPETAADKALDGPSMAAGKAASTESGYGDDLARDEKKKDSAAPASRAAPAPKESQRREPGGAAPDPQLKVRTDFGSSAGWFAAVEGTGERPGRVTAALTDSLTSWRATAYLVTTSEKLGVGHGSVRASKPLMVRLEAPRFFTERDEVTLSAIATSRLGAPVDAEVSLEVGPELKPLSPTRARLHLEAGADARFDARFKVVEPGTVKLRATAKGAGKGDAMEWSLPVVVHGSAQRQYFAGRLGDKVSFDFVLPDKRKPQLTRLELQLSPSVLSVIFDSLPYLAEYPYGCVEQTLSRFVPATIAAKAVKDFHLSKDRVPADLDDKVQAGLKRLYDFQHPDGGWGWWKEDSTNRWMSAYVVYGLSLAHEAGVQVDSGVLERGRSYLKNALGAALNDPDLHVWMSLALAKSGAAFKPGLDADFAARGRLSPKGKALLALALQAAGDRRERIAVENLDDVVKAAAARADASVGEANDAWSTSAAIESTSYVLMAMAHHDLKSPALAPLTDFLMLRRNGGKWRSTRDTAFAVYALAELARLEAQSSRAGSFVVKVNGREVKRLAFAKGGVGLAPLVLDDAALRPGANHVEITRDGSRADEPAKANSRDGDRSGRQPAQAEASNRNGTGYWAATYDVYNQNDFIKGVGGDVKVKRTYTLLGKPSTQPGSAETEYGMPVDSGVRVRVDLEVTANKAVEYVMVEDLKPAGFEAVEQNSGPQVCNYQCAHAELRTDRVAMFLTAIPVGVTRLSYELRAEVPGKFNALPARLEAMYAPEIQATADEMRFEVRDEASAGVARP